MPHVQNIFCEVHSWKICSEVCQETDVRHMTKNYTEELHVTKHQKKKPIFKDCELLSVVPASAKAEPHCDRGGGLLNVTVQGKTGTNF